MTENYKLIYDSEQLRAYFVAFVQNVCNVHIAHTCSLKIMLKARRKYNLNAKQSKSTVVILRTSFDLHNSADDFVQKIKRFEVAQGLYTDRDRKTGTVTPIAPEALVLYVTSNAMSRIEATKKIVKQVVNDSLFCESMIPTLCATGDDDDDNGATGDDQPFFSLDKQFLTMLHKSPATKMQRLDVDTQEPEFLAQLDQLLKQEKADIIFVIRTPNGYHYVVRSGRFMQAVIQFCAKNSKQISCDNNGMNALPGVLQGGRPVQLVFAKGSAVYNKLPSEHAAVTVQTPPAQLLNMLSDEFSEIKTLLEIEN